MTEISNWNINERSNIESTILRKSPKQLINIKIGGG